MSSSSVFVVFLVQVALRVVPAKLSMPSRAEREAAALHLRSAAVRQLRELRIALLSARRDSLALRLQLRIVGRLLRVPAPTRVESESDEEA